MRALANWVMAGRSQAALVIACAMFLALLLPPLMFVSGAALALVALRRGGGEGGLVLGFAAAGSLAIAWLLFGSPGPVLTVLPGFWLPVLLLAVVLRASVSLAVATLVAVLLGWVAVLGFHLLVDDTAAWWLQVLNASIRQALGEAGMDSDGMVAVDEILQFLAPLMTGIVAANGALSALLALLLGRGWQALLYNPGGLRREFHALRLGRWPAVVMMALLATVALAHSPFAGNLAIVAGAAYVLQGLAVVHGLVGLRGMSRVWLVALYLALLLALPQVGLGLIALALVDAWADLRARVRRPISTERRDP
ncbi:hypothetical protein EV699_12722 [Plasticicumulans lactativorans]|uniref:Uncharacterized protein n=1 Tax=Plasticicumulans lactativorans TaxID=1133106 RepID=A0A4R2KRR1_9GAMM|nr:hypothetical protein [Plasticicumulans lactativorans]TCO76981.1 hypothetical protein EV699_12722 [Plasticicumulans lactativorans]